jgi:hypothetical protein
VLRPKTLGVSNEGAFPLLKILPTTTARRIRVRPKFSSFDRASEREALNDCKRGVDLANGLTQMERSRAIRTSNESLELNPHTQNMWVNRRSGVTRSPASPRSDAGLRRIRPPRLVRQGINRPLQSGHDW